MIQFLSLIKSRIIIMKAFVCILAFVAYVSAGGVSSYGSGVAIGSLGSYGLGSGLESNSGLGVQRLAVSQPIYSSGSIGLGQPIGLNQGQTIRKVSVSQPILTPVSVQRPVLTQAVKRVSVAQPIVTGRSLGISSVPVRSVSIAQPRTVTLSQPILSAQPIRRTVQVARQPLIASAPISLGQTQGVRRVTTTTISQPILTPVRSVVSQPILSSSKINLGGASYGSGLGLGLSQAQPLRRVSVVQPSLSAGISSVPVLTSSSYGLGSGLNSIGGKGSHGVIYGK
ncbi:uncharacterized protein LOC129943990 [Eupeodes corollae]|uniref:uncharacterized protein LOC129943990 n=1 Tax=Eupeodes corollae TaxID=290404 RepID=UPI00248FE7D5|nr:uncharacterized protein LOC129943990 [Eupeodes corollae]